MCNHKYKTRVNHRVVTALLLLGSLMASAPAAAAPFAYITNSENHTVAVMDTATDAVIATVPVGSGPYSIAVNPTGTRIYMTNDSAVSVINTATDTVIATVPVGSGPYGLVVNPMGTRVYVANYFSDTVSVIDTETNTVVATVPVGKGPSGVAMTPDRAEVNVLNSIDNTIFVINTSTNKVTATASVGEEKVASDLLISTTAFTAFETDFNAGVPPEFVNVATTQVAQEFQTIGAGQNTFNGDFLRSDASSQTTLTLTHLPTHTHVGVRFLLAVIDAWNGKGCAEGEDILNITVDGEPLFSESFENSGCGTATYIPPSGVTLIAAPAGGVQTNGSGPSAVAGTTAYNMGLDPVFHGIPHTANMLTITWFSNRTGVQTVADGTETNKSWAIENLAVVLNGTKDTDGDSVLDGRDNCLEIKNVAQTDSDVDGRGNPCDLDDDNDGILDQADNCPLVANVAQTDTNKDGIGDACAVVLPTILIREASIKEGGDGLASAVFEVSLSQPTTAVLTVDYATSDGTARAGFDYIQRAGTLTFSPGVTTQNVIIPIIGDRLNEKNETFFLNLTKPTLSPVLSTLMFLMYTFAPFGQASDTDCWSNGACASNAWY